MNIICELPLYNYFFRNVIEFVHVQFHISNLMEVIKVRVFQQKNSFDCGAFTLFNAYCLSHPKRYVFLREEFRSDLLRTKLLHELFFQQMFEFYPTSK